VTAAARAEANAAGERSEERDLQRMANQIAANFAHHEPAVATAEVANHLRMFWTPEMRRLLSEMAASGEWELHPLVRAGLGSLAA
jgi:hypothetical protein